MSRKLVCVWLFILVFLSLIRIAQAQDGKIPKIGWLGARSASAPARDVFRREIRALGYIENKNISFEERYAEGKLDRLPALAGELVRLKVNVLVAAATPAAAAGKKATKSIPIVFYSGSDPVALGLVDSLPRPGENITGFTVISSVLTGKRLELLKETLPKLSSVAALLNSGDAISEQTWKESQLPARELGLQLHAIEANTAEQLEPAFKTAIKANAEALSVMGGPFFFLNRKLVADLAIKYRLPAMYPLAEFVLGGGLMSYGADEDEGYRRIALMVDKILKGAKPADLPVEQPTKFELLINLKSAKQIGLIIPPHVLARADRLMK